MDILRKSYPYVFTDNITANIIRLLIHDEMRGKYFFCERTQTLCCSEEGNFYRLNHRNLNVPECLEEIDAIRSFRIPGYHDPTDKSLPKRYFITSGNTHPENSHEKGWMFLIE